MAWIPDPSGLTAIPLHTIRVLASRGNVRKRIVPEYGILVAQRIRYRIELTIALVGQVNMIAFLRIWQSPQKR